VIGYIYWVNKKLKLLGFLTGISFFIAFFQTFLTLYSLDRRVARGDLSLPLSSENSSIC